MIFSLVFDHSGDSLEFESVNTEILEYYVDQLNQSKHNHFVSRSPGKISQAIDRMDSVIRKLNLLNIDQIIGSQFKELKNENYLNQHLLNKLHADWVISQSMLYDIKEHRKKYSNSKLVETIHDAFPDNIPTPTVADVLTKTGLDELYDDINLSVHWLEESLRNFNFTVSNSPWVEFNNPFSKSCLTNDIGNFRITFNHLGRTLYNKYTHFDLDLQYKDENSYDQLLGFVDISLQPCQTIPFSKEYTDWCRYHNREPIGDNLILGNVKNLKEKLYSYRLIIFRNLQNDNGFSIQLNRG